MLVPTVTAQMQAAVGFAAEPPAHANLGEGSSHNGHVILLQVMRKHCDIMPKGVLHKHRAFSRAACNNILLKPLPPLQCPLRQPWTRLSPAQIAWCASALAIFQDMTVMWMQEYG